MTFKAAIFAATALSTVALAPAARAACPPGVDPASWGCGTPMPGSVAQKTDLLLSFRGSLGNTATRPQSVQSVISAITQADVAASLGYTPANRAGDTFTGAVTLGAGGTLDGVVALNGSMAISNGATISSPSVVFTGQTSIPPLVTWDGGMLSGTVGVGGATQTDGVDVNFLRIDDNLQLNNAAVPHLWNSILTWGGAGTAGGVTMRLDQVNQNGPLARDIGSSRQQTIGGYALWLKANNSMGGTDPTHTSGLLYNLNIKLDAVPGAGYLALTEPLGETDFGVAATQQTVTVTGSATANDTLTLTFNSNICNYNNVATIYTVFATDTNAMIVNGLTSAIKYNKTLSSGGLVGPGSPGALSTTLPTNVMNIGYPLGCTDMTVAASTNVGATETLTVGPVVPGASTSRKYVASIVLDNNNGSPGTDLDTVFIMGQKTHGANVSSGGFQHMMYLGGGTIVTAEGASDLGDFPMTDDAVWFAASQASRAQGLDEPIKNLSSKNVFDLHNVNFTKFDGGPLLFPGTETWGDGSLSIGGVTFQRVYGGASPGLSIQPQGWEATAVAIGTPGGATDPTDPTHHYSIGQILWDDFGGQYGVTQVTNLGGLVTASPVCDTGNFHCTWPSSPSTVQPSSTLTLHGGSGDGSGATVVVTWGAATNLTLGVAGGTVNLLGTVNGSIAPSLVQATNGLNPRSLANWFGDTVNALGQNVAGNGSTDDAAKLLAASGLAQSSGNVLFLPTPSSSYLLNSDWKPAAGDLSVFVSPGATFSGPGLPKFDNQFPHYAYPIYSSILNTRTYGSFYNPYANVDLEEDIAVNTGTANVVAIQGVGISTTTTSPTWGADFVCEQQAVSGASCNGVEIDTINTVSGGNAYGLVVSAQGSFSSNSAITIGATASGIQWTNGLVFQQTATGGLAPATNALIETTAFSGSTGKGMYMRGSYSNFEMSWPSLLVGATQSSTTSRIGLLGGTGTGATIQVVPNDGGSTANEAMVLRALGNATITLGNADGTGFVVQDGGASTINAGYVKPSATGTAVTFGCGLTGDANVGCIISPRGTGTLTVQNTGGGPSAQFIAAASANTRINFTAGVSGAAPIISEGGTAANLAITAGSNTIQFAGTGTWTANATTAVTLTALGPAGASTTVVKWLTVVDNTGATRYIPAY